MMALIMVAPSSVLASTTYTSYSTTSSTSHGTPGKMTVAGGTLWYVESPATGPSITQYLGNMSTAGIALGDYSVTPSGATTFLITSLTTGPDGNVWFMGTQNGYQGIIGSFNITTNTVAYYPHPSAVASSYTNIVAGPDGNMWYAAKGSGGAMDYTYLVKIDLATGISTSSALPDYTANVTSLAAGPDGGLWYTDAHNNKVFPVAINGSGGGPSVTIPTANSDPRGIIKGPDGNIWLIEANKNKIAKITMARTVTEYTLPTGMGMEDWRAGTDNALWFGGVSGGVKVIGRVSSSGLFAQYGLPTGTTNILGLAWGPDETPWFSTGSGGGALVRLNLVPSYATYSTTSPTAYGVPGKMTIAGGTLWYVESPATGPFVKQYLGNMNTAGVVLGDYDVTPSGATTFQITSLTTGPDGNVWFTASQDGYPGRIGSFNITTGTVTYYPHPSAVSSRYTNIVAGPDGNMWYAAKGSGGSLDYTYLVKIDITTGTSSIRALPDYSASITSLAAGPDGGLWYTDTYNNKVWPVAVNGYGGGSSVAIPTASSNPSGIVAGPDGNMWLIEGGKVAKITMAHAITEYSLPTGVTSPSILTTGTDNALWFTANSGSSKIIGRISSSGLITQYGLPTGTTNILGLAWGPDEALWFSTASGGGGLVQLGYYF